MKDSNEDARAQKEKCLNYCIKKIQHFGMAHETFLLRQVRELLAQSRYADKYIRGLSHAPSNALADDVMWLVNVLVKIGVFKKLGGQAYSCWKEQPIITWEEAHTNYKTYLANR